MVLTSKKDQLELEKLGEDNTDMKDTKYIQYGADRPDCTTSRVWMILAVVFLVTSVALGSYLVYVKIGELRQQTSYEEEIIRKYPGYFRTPEEQAIFEEQYNQVAVVTKYSKVNIYTQVNCTFSCQTYRRKRAQGHPLMEIVKLYSIMKSMSKRAATQDDGNTYHACCKSKHTFISPDSAEDADGKTVKIIKLNNQAQYFHNETCQQSDGCTGCRCGQGTTLTAAVVRSADSSVGIKMIKLPGCCKCFNGVPT